MILLLTLLIAPLAIAGIALINAGLGRSRSAAHSMMGSLCVVSIAVLVWFLIGFAIQGLPGPGVASSWVGHAGLFLSGVPMTAPLVTWAAIWMGTLSVGLTAMIPLGSGADRWRLGAICASTVLLAGLIFPLFAHWAWGGGWLAALGFLDPAGSGTIHATGGLTALAVTWLLGARRGKYTSEGMPMAIPGHNPVLVLFGSLLALTGWIGWNAAGASLYAGVISADRIPLMAVNTILCAAAAACAAAVTTRLRFGKPDASLTANGWVGGLVASSAVCAFVPPAAAVLVGLIAGVLVSFSVELLELHAHLDDPGGSISAHALGGIWGLLALGLFGREQAGGPGQLLAQIVGIGTLLGFVLPLTYGLNAALDRVSKQRVSAEGEHQGMDLHELGAGAYPEFMTHTDEIMR